MHVVLLSHEYPPFIYGGVGTFVKNLAKGLHRKGVKITVISGYPVPLGDANCIESKENNSGINVVRFPYFNIPPRQTIFQLLNLKKLYGTVKNTDADVVHGQSGSTFPALLNLRKLAPIVTTFHSSPKVEKRVSAYSIGRGGSLGDFRTYVIGYPVMSFVFRQELSGSHISVAVSQTLMSELLEEMGEAYREKICAIHNGVDIDTLDREYKSVEADVEESRDIILFAGRLFWRKGALNIIKIAYLLQKERLSLNLLVHGNGPLFRRMENEIRDLELNNIKLKGFTSRAQLMRSMKRSRFVVIPSFYEACPMILLESMCLGKIPIMYDLPYAREFTLNGKYGILAKNAEDMAMKIKSIFEHGDTRHLKNEIRNYARKKYDINKVALDYYHLYKEILN